MRLTLMALAPGGVLPAHTTDAQVSIHMVKGDVTFVAIDREYALTSGDVFILAPGVEHAARSIDGAEFLLTVVHGAKRATSEVAALPIARHPISDAARQRWNADDTHRSVETPE